MVIWGLKTEAMFDLWTLEHFANGIGIAALAALSTGKLLKKYEQKTEIDPSLIKSINFIVVLTLSLLWECIEHYIEAGILPGMAGSRVTFWFQGVEHWSNRLVGDTCVVMLGWYVYNRVKKLAIPAKVFSLVWLLVHIFVFPDSMYLQRLLTP